MFGRHTVCMPETDAADVDSREWARGGREAVSGTRRRRSRLGGSWRPDASVVGGTEWA